MSTKEKPTTRARIGSANKTPRLAKELTVEQKMMAYLDGEMNAHQVREFEEILSSHPEWRNEVESLQGVLAGSKAVRYKQIKPDLWDDYWEEIDAKLTGKSTGLVLAAVGGGLLAVAGISFLYSVLSSTLAFIGLSIMLVGILLLYLSVLRGFIAERKKDRYRRIKR
ncbi:MAG: anti-sigma factor family protein [Sumerlaeia bacterium]